MFMSPPATRSLHPGLWLSHPTYSCLSQCPSPVPPHPSPLLVQAAPSRYLSPPSSIIPCLGWFSEGSWGCQWSVPSEGSEPATPCRIQGSGLLCPFLVSRTHFTPTCLPAFPAGSSVLSFQPWLRPLPLPSALPSQETSTPPLIPIQGPLSLQLVPGVCDPSSPTGLSPGCSSSMNRVYIEAPEPGWRRALQELPLSCPHTSSPLRSGQ